MMKRATLSRSRRPSSGSPRRACVPQTRLHDLRHTHGTLLIAAGVPVKVVSERLGHATPTFTIETYQHVLPGMQVDAAPVFEQLIVPGVLRASESPVEGRGGAPEEGCLGSVEGRPTEEGLGP